MNTFKHQNITDITKYLPHREPMLMVDIIDYIDDHYVETTFHIPPQVIFASNGRFTEVGLIENAAQTCSAIVGQRYFFDENHNEIENVEVVGFISAVKKIEIFRLPETGNKIHTKAVLESEFNGGDYTICTMKVDIFGHNVLLLSGVMNLFLQKLGT